ncbi:MAG: hypothetical protein ABR981_00170 [Candidatus Micrarchaeaceae archaeon]|jgi:uncharacterized membrane protein
MGILNIFGKKDATSDIAKGPPYSVVTELVPYKLYAKKNSSATLRIKVRNLTKEVLLTSLVGEVPNHLGFDEMIMSKQREIRVGEMQPNEEKELKMNLYTSLGSEKGEYTMTLTTIAHYRDYGHVLNALKKRIAIELV